MNSNQTREARTAAFTAYEIASAAFNTAFAAEGKCRKVTRLANLAHKAMEDYRFAQARHEHALRAEMAGAAERDIMAAALA